MTNKKINSAPSFKINPEVFSTEIESLSFYQEDWADRSYYSSCTKMQDKIQEVFDKKQISKKDFESLKEKLKAKTYKLLKAFADGSSGKSFFMNAGFYVTQERAYQMHLNCGLITEEQKKELLELSKKWFKKTLLEKIIPNHVDGPRGGYKGMYTSMEHAIWWIHSANKIYNFTDADYEEIMPAVENGIEIWLMKSLKDNTGEREMEYWEGNKKKTKIAKKYQEHGTIISYFETIIRFVIGFRNEDLKVSKEFAERIMQMLLKVLDEEKILEQETTRELEHFLMFKVVTVLNYNKRAKLPEELKIRFEGRLKKEFTEKGIMEGEEGYFSEIGLFDAKTLAKMKAKYEKVKFDESLEKAESFDVLKQLYESLKVKSQKEKVLAKMKDKGFIE